METSKFNIGTLDSDTISPPKNGWALGLDGDDVLFASIEPGTNNLAGGLGNDTYRIRSDARVNIIDTALNSNDTYDINSGSIVNIFDNGGVDHINLKHIAFNSPYTKIWTSGIYNNLIIENTLSKTAIQIINWSDPNHAIESISFSDGTYNLPSNLRELIRHPKFHRDIANFEFLQQGVPREVLNPSFWPNAMREVAAIEFFETIERSPDLSLNHKSTKLSIIVAPSVLDEKAVLLEGLNETFVYMNDTLIAHSIEYAGTTYNYSDLVSIITTVTRDGEFTQEFAQEIAEFDAGASGISYQTAVQLIGQAQINDTLLYVAGADGSYIS